MSFTSDLLIGTAGLLQDAEIATVSSEAIGDAATALSFKVMPQTPDRVVVLTSYQVSDEAVTPLSRLALQVLCRGVVGNPLDVDDLADSIFLVLHGLTSRLFGSVWVAQMLRNSSIPLGEDTNRRWKRSDNYYVDVNPPTGLYRS